MKNKLPIVILSAIVIGYICLEIFGPQPTDWSTNYGNSKTTPFGSQLLYEGLEDLFPGQAVIPVEKPLHKQLEEFEQAKSNYVIVQQSLKLTQEEANALLRYVENGNTVFVAATVFEGKLGQELDLNPDSFWDLFYKEEFGKDEYLTFTNAYDSNSVHYPLLDNVYYNSLPAHSVTEILSRNKDGKAVFGRIDRGDGHLYLHSVPLIFTNYFMVDPVNHNYISQAFSFLPNQKTYWDEYYKPGRTRIESPVRFLLDQRSLSWAWYLLLATTILFIIFQGKRKQRTIPIVEPPTNATLEFTKTVGQLYYQHGDHKDIAEKKIRFLLEYIRNRWNLPSTHFEEEFRHRLHQKSGVPRDRLDKLFNLALQIRAKEKVSELVLQTLHQLMEDFYRSTR